MSEGLVFQNFLGGMPPDFQDLACFACQIVYFACNYHAHSNIIVLPLSESWICPCFQSCKYVQLQHQVSSLKLPATFWLFLDQFPTQYNVTFNIIIQ